MSNYKQLQIKQLREHIFVIEKLDTNGDWIILNHRGEAKRDALESCEYKSFEEADRALREFLHYPKIVKHAEVPILKAVPVSTLQLKDDFYKKEESTIKSAIKAVSFLSKTQKLEELAVNLCEIEKSMNEIAVELNLQPFKITIGRINENVDNPI